MSLRRSRYPPAVRFEAEQAMAEEFLHHAISRLLVSRFSYACMSAAWMWAEGAGVSAMPGRAGAASEEPKSFFWILVHSQFPSSL